jgi:hypothetical protein
MVEVRANGIEVGEGPRTPTTRRAIAEARQELNHCH